MRHPGAVAATAALVVAAGALPRDAAGQGAREVSLPPPNAQLETEFTRVSAVRALGDGRVLVSDAGEVTLYVADFTKQTATPVGRRGRGPNEYAGLTALFPLSNDSTLLPDPRSGRWLLLHGAAIVATVPPDSPPIRSGARTLFGAATNGFVLATASARNFELRGSFTTGAEDSLWIVRVARSTGTIDTLAKARTRASRVTVRGSGNAQTVEVVVNPISVGEQAALFLDGWVAVARLDPYRVDWIAPDRRMVRGPELPQRRVPVDDDAKRWILEEMAQQSGRAPRRPESMPDDWPATIPPFVSSALLAAPDGTLWIRRAATEPRARPTYDVVDRQGRLVRRLSTARNERLVGFGPGVLYVVATDDDGIQRLQRHVAPR